MKVPGVCLIRLISRFPHNALDKYPTMHRFVTEMCKFLLQNGALWDMGQVHCGICATGLFCCNGYTLVKYSYKLWIDWNINASYMKYLEMPRPVRWEPMPHFNFKIIVPGMEISIIKIRWSWDHLIFIYVMGIPILIRQHLCIKMLLPQSLVNIMVSCYWWMGLIIATIWIYFHSYTSMFSCYLNCCMFWAFPQEIWDWLLYFSMNYLKIILSKVFKSRRIENWFAQRPFQALLWSFRFF